MINKNLVTLKANYLADTMQSELIKKTIWSNVSIVSYNIPLLAMRLSCSFPFDVLSLVILTNNSTKILMVIIANAILINKL